jgi:hypothetical protein
MNLMPSLDSNARPYRPQQCLVVRVSQTIQNPLCHWRFAYSKHSECDRIPPRSPGTSMGQTTNQLTDRCASEATASSTLEIDDNNNDSRWIGQSETGNSSGTTLE